MEFITDSFFIILKVYAVYFLVISIFAFKKSRSNEVFTKHHRFAALIPARNEEICIAGIVESLLLQNYPRELLDIYVIPNNCTDNTKAAAVNAGARVLDMPSWVNSKGKALNEAMMALLDKGYDAFLVFDADNEVSPDFASEMDKTLSSGARVAKSRILAKNSYQSWVCACYEIHFCFANTFINRARSAIGLSARVIGTGFAVKTELIREIGGFPCKTITEDAEFFAECSARGEYIAFCENAVTYDEEPTSFRVSLTQRRRWMSGIMQVTQTSFLSIIRGFKAKTTFKLCADAFLQLTFNWVQALIPFFLILSALLDIPAFLSSLPMTVMLWYLGSAGNAVISLAFQKRINGKILSGILMYPFFVATFIPLQTLALFNKTNNWKEIKHSGIRLCSSHQNAA